MQFQRHDVLQNLNNALATKDTEMAAAVLIDEVNELVLDHPAEVKSMLEKSSVRVSSKPSHEELATLVVENWDTNPAIHKGLAQLIVQRHSNPYVHADAGQMDVYHPIEGIGFQNAAGDDGSGGGGQQGGGGGMIGGIIGGVGGLAQGIGAITGGKTQVKLKKEETKQQLLAALLQKKQQRGMKTGMSTGLKIGLIIGGVVVVAAIVFAAIKISAKSNQQQAPAA